MSEFLNLLRDNWSPSKWQQDRTVIAVSGGADSVALLRGMHELAPEQCERLTVAHFNHGLRGEESDGDEVFVRSLADALKVAYRVGHAAAGSLTKSGQDGIEASARAARYDFLREAAHEIGARYILTAHTFEDQVETVLHRILRGTGIKGLEGISIFRELSEMTVVARPMISATRQMVVDYLHEIKQPYREDSSNQSDAFTRNRIRKLLPVLERDFNPQVRNALFNLSMQASDMVEVLDDLTEGWFETAVTYPADNQVSLDLKFMQAQPEPLVRHFLTRLWEENEWPMQGMSFDHWEALTELLGAEVEGPPAIDLPGGIRARLSQRATKVVIRAPLAEGEVSDEEAPLPMEREPK